MVLRQCRLLALPLENFFHSAMLSFLSQIDPDHLLDYFNIFKSK